MAATSDWMQHLVGLSNPMQHVVGLSAPTEAANVYKMLYRSGGDKMLKAAVMDIIVLLVCMEIGMSDRGACNKRMVDMFETWNEDKNLLARVHLPFGRRCVRERTTVAFRSKASRRGRRVQL